MKAAPVSDPAVRELIGRAIAEDVGTGDVTTMSVVPEAHTSTGKIVAKAGGVIAGMDIARAVFTEIEPGVSFTPKVADGDSVEAGDVIALVEGPTRGILTGERVALNFLQRLSGIATSTASFAAALRGSGTRVLDTRKTTPGLRALEKYAVRVGGGVNHRHGLYDMILIKDNHIAAAGVIAEAVNRARTAYPDLKLEVETRTLNEVEQAVNAGADRIMLDNMAPAQLEKAIAAVRSGSRSIEVEISGGVTPETVGSLAGLGAEFVSVGALTHSVRALDMSLELTGT